MMLSTVSRLFESDVIDCDVKINAISTDTRSIKKNDLFIALRGENFDAHDYINVAAEKGAIAALVEHEVEATIPCIVVKDTKLALGELAAYWRQQLDVKVIGLTGSNGKTTVKDMLTSILSEVGSVIATAGNFNNDIGLPLSLLKIETDHQFAVIEMGANHKGEIAYLTQLTKPDVAILNNAGPAHLEGFGSLQGVAEAKAEIFSGLPQHGIAIINIDDTFSSFWQSVCVDKKQYSFGFDPKADVTINSDIKNYHGQFKLHTPKAVIEIQLQVLGLHNLKNALAASAAAIALGIEMPAIKAGLEKFVGVKGRLQVFQAANDSIIIDDSYNANPASTKAAIDVLSEQNKKTVFVLADMGELGADAESLHAEIGEYAKAKKIDVLMTYGDLAQHAANNFGLNAQSFEDKEQLIEQLKKQINQTVAVLVKGSRSMHMEDVVSALVDHSNLGAT